MKFINKTYLSNLIVEYFLFLSYNTILFLKFLNLKLIVLQLILDPFHFKFTAKDNFSFRYASHKGRLKRIYRKIECVWCFCTCAFFCTALCVYCGRGRHVKVRTNLRSKQKNKEKNGRHGITSF